MKSNPIIAGYRTLEGRYALLECLAISTIGKIYQGRDLEQVRTHGMDSRILIHLLPANLNKLPIETVFQQISRTYKQAGYDWIMPPRAFGQDENNSYVIMDCPSGQNLISYVRQAYADHSTLSRQIGCQLQPLSQKGLLTKQVDPALLVTSAENKLYLLATALSPDIQALQSLSQPSSIKCKTINMLVAGLSLGALSTLSVLAANYVFQPETVAYNYKPAKQTAQPLQLASLAPQMELNSQALANSDRQVSAINDSLALENNTETPLKPETQPTSHSTTAATQTAEAKPVKPKEKTKSPDSSKQQQTPVKAAITRQAPPQQKATKAIQKPEPLDFDKLVELAEAAMRTGHYGDNRTGALYYTRQVRSLSHLHPQVKRLSQAIVSHHHQQTRAALKQHDLERAGQLLSLSKAIIKEFNLVTFNPAQTLLEHKAAAME